MTGVFVQGARMLRTHNCGELGPQNIGHTVTLAGWVSTTRDHGGLTFIDLRDRSGIVQVVFDPANAAEAHEQAKQVRNEFVVRVQGEVAARPAGAENPNLPTGAIEVKADSLEILNAARTPPFVVGDDNVDENIRLRYRYLDLRSPRMQRNLRLRAQMARACREYLDSQGFIEIETPLLIRSTPEGARDYLVPSRILPGSFYALPQSPQLLKQLLMVSGMERYYQLARCLRDEDLRANRQPEFTQIDIEMSFADENDVISISEGLMRAIFRVAGVELTPPFPRLEYAEAMTRFGTDKPDMRFGMELQDVSACFAQTGFAVFRQVLDSGGVVLAIKAKAAGDWPRREIEGLSATATRLGAKGLVTFAFTAEGPKSPMLKHFSASEIEALKERLQAAQGDLALLVADDFEAAATVLGRLRLHMARALNLIDARAWSLVWITGFPLFAHNEQGKRIEPMHHPFSSPLEQDMPLLDSDPLKVRGRLYDLVINGEEVGGGSVRIHQRALQEKVLQIIQMPPEEARRRFGFLMEAFEYGAPPHAGIAFGFDRLVALAVGEVDPEGIRMREVMAFPKASSGLDPLLQAPSPVDEEQLRDLGLRLAE